MENPRVLKKRKLSFARKCQIIGFLIGGGGTAVSLLVAYSLMDRTHGVRDGGMDTTVGLAILLYTPLYALMKLIGQERILDGNSPNPSILMICLPVLVNSAALFLAGTIFGWVVNKWRKHRD